MENNWKKVNLIDKLKNIKEFYLVNELGQVKRCAYSYKDKNGVIYNKKEIILEINYDSSKNGRVNLYDINGEKYNVPVAFLVASIFINNPNNYTSIEFKDGDSRNIKYDNLNWVTAYNNPKYDTVKSLDGEVWKTIKNFPNYQASNLGRIKSISRDVFNNISSEYISIPKEAKLINQTIEERTGYYVVGLQDENKLLRTKRVHRIIAETFILNPDNLPQVDHINHDKSNNSVSNLRWVTPLENSRNGGTTKIKITFPDSREEVVDSIIKAAEISGFTTSGIKKHCSSEIPYKPGNFGFRYLDDDNLSLKLGQNSRKNIKEVKNQIIEKLEKIGYDLSEIEKSNNSIIDNKNIFPINLQVKNCSTTPNYFNIKSTFDSSKPVGVYWNKTSALDNKEFFPVVFIDSKTFFKLMKIYKIVKDKNPNLLL